MYRLPRVALRSTRGYIPTPLRGEPSVRAMWSATGGRFEHSGARGGGCWWCGNARREMSSGSGIASQCSSTLGNAPPATSIMDRGRPDGSGEPGGGAFLRPVGALGWGGLGPRDAPGASDGARFGGGGDGKWQIANGK